MSAHTSTHKPTLLALLKVFQGMKRFRIQQQNIMITITAILCVLIGMHSFQARDIYPH